MIESHKCVLMQWIESSSVSTNMPATNGCILAVFFKQAGGQSEGHTCSLASSAVSRLCMILMMCVHSWNLGPAHIISLSTEVYFYLEYGLELIFKQYEWLKKDLEVSDHSNYTLTMTKHFPLFPHLFSVSHSLSALLSAHY